MTNNCLDFQHMAEEAAMAAGDLLREKWGGALEIRNKGFRDWVTDADIAAQDIITDLILNRYPDHGFITEEDAPNLKSSGDVIWIIDPLDGTTNYGRQHPIYCTSIAAAQKDKNDEYHVVAGAIYDPMGDELFSGGRGLGSKLNGDPISVSESSTLESSLIGLDWSRRQVQRQAILDATQRIAHQVRTMRAIGSASLALAWVACGRLDLYFNVGVGSWDVAAAKIIIHEAGGNVTDHRGVDWSTGSTTCIASNGKIHQQFLESSLLGDWR
jgi:myo-inositol-1(or 4)-monophosphatase